MVASCSVAPRSWACLNRKTALIRFTSFGGAPFRDDAPTTCAANFAFPLLAIPSRKLCSMSITHLSTSPARSDFSARRMASSDASCLSSGVLLHRASSRLIQNSIALPTGLSQSMSPFMPPVQWVQHQHPGAACPNSPPTAASLPCAHQRMLPGRMRRCGSYRPHGLAGLRSHRRPP